jgi:FtsP/CotA-like multicopper oxidase with cupredoxin domain
MPLRVVWTCPRASSRSARSVRSSTRSGQPAPVPGVARSKTSMGAGSLWRLPAGQRENLSLLRSGPAPVPAASSQHFQWTVRPSCFRKSNGIPAGTEGPLLGSTEIWSILNGTEDSHPIHLHVVRFQVLDRRNFYVMNYLRKRELRFTGRLCRQIPTKWDGRARFAPTPAW